MSYWTLTVYLLLCLTDTPCLPLCLPYSQCLLSLSLRRKLLGFFTHRILFMAGRNSGS